MDGDTLYIAPTRLRLLSMDAFETAQNCLRNGKNYACGFRATAALTALLRGRELRCEGDKRDRYHRPLVRCWIRDLDVGREMVRQGWAVAEFGHDYDADEQQARAAKVGAWSGTFERPKEWRRSGLR